MRMSRALMRGSRMESGKGVVANALEDNRWKVRGAVGQRPLVASFFWQRLHSFS